LDLVVLAAAEDGRFDVVLFIYNYLKTDVGDKILAACKAKGMGTTLMKIASFEARYKSQGKEVPEAFKKLAESARERAAQLEDRYRAFRPEEIAADPAGWTYSVDENGDGVSDYAFPNPNFNFLQFRSNLVIRWEYRPGSVLYLKSGIQGTRYRIKRFGSCPPNSRISFQRHASNGDVIGPLR